MSRLDKLKTKLSIDKMQDLEKDIMFFYDYLIFLKVTMKEDSYLNYSGIYLAANKLILINGLPSYSKARFFTESNMITNYVKLTKTFKLSEFENAVFDIDEIRLVRNQWRLLF